MVKFFKGTGLAVLLLWGVQLHAQDAHTLIKEGIQLNNARNYSGAIEKYRAALTLEPDNASANYQMAFSLQAEGKGTDALPYLQKVVRSASSAAIISSAYGLMGGIYDQSGQALKAIETYQQSIKADSSSYSLFYGLGLAYFRNHQYAEAEQTAIRAIAVDSQQAGSMRLYALVCFHQNKRAPALLGFCRFLQLEPNGPLSAEAYGNIQHILQGGVLKPQPGAPAMHPNPNTLALNRAITNAKSTAAGQNTEQLSYQLRTIFKSVGTLAQKQADNGVFFSRLATYYEQLSQSPQMQTFAYYISQSKDAKAAAWLKEHPQQLAALMEWFKNTKL